MTTFFTSRCAGWSSLVTVQLLASPAAIVPAHSAEKIPGEYPVAGPPDSLTLYAPGSRLTRVPASLPAKLAGFGLVPLTCMVQLAATAPPLLSFCTCLVTVSVATTSSLVMVQVRCSPTPICPLQSGPALIW